MRPHTTFLEPRALVRWTARHGGARLAFRAAAWRGDPLARLVMDPALRADPYPQYEQLRVAPVVPGKVADPVQRVRNLLFVAAVPDVFQMPVERYVPQLVFDRIVEEIPRDDLIKILFWIGLHPTEGDDSAVDELRVLGLTNGPSDLNETRYRAMVYALKLLGRLVGKIKL